jgi:hypothetical protein
MSTEHQHHHKEEHFYFVDEKRYESHDAHITGEAIKAKLPEPERLHALFEIEGHGEHRHYRPIHNDTKVSLEGAEKHFTTKHKHKEKYPYFVDGVEYESEEAHTTGAIIKSKLPEPKRAYALYLEGRGKHHDELINPDTSVSFEHEKEPKRFYTVPAASFGCA